MRNFEILFDQGEPSPLADPAYAPYGKLGFPQAPAERPWIYSNFVQSLDGIVSFGGLDASGSALSQSAEDRWLMDLLRANADAVLLGMSTLREEARLGDETKRGPVFRIMDTHLRALRSRLGYGREKNIFVTGSASVELAKFRVFDGNYVDPWVVTTAGGAARLAGQGQKQVKVIVAGQGRLVDLEEMARILRRDFGVRYLLCEGGPTLYGNMSRAGLIDEKFLTIAPLEVGAIVPPEQPAAPWEDADQLRRRPTTFEAVGFTRQNAPRWRWMSCRRIEDYEFNRYRRVGRSA